MFRICTPCILKEHLRFAYFTAFLALKCLLAFDFVCSLIELIVNFICLRSSHQNIKQRLKLSSESSSDKSTSSSLPMLASFSQSYSLILLCKRLFPSRRTCQTITITNLLNDPPSNKAKYDILSRYLILPNRKLYKNTSSVPLHGHVTFLSFDPQHNLPPPLKFAG